MRSKVTSLAAVPTENLIHVVMIEVNNADYILPSTRNVIELSFTLRCSSKPSQICPYIYRTQPGRLLRHRPAPMKVLQTFGRQRLHFTPIYKA